MSESRMTDLYNRPTILMCKQCGLTRVADNYDEAKAKADVHGKESKHYDIELLTLDDCPGRTVRPGGAVHRKVSEVSKPSFRSAAA
jgi:hypothetical protein